MTEWFHARGDWDGAMKDEGGSCGGTWVCAQACGIVMTDQQGLGHGTRFQYPKDDHSTQGHCAIMNVSDIFEFAHEEHGKRESTVDNVG